MEWLEVVRLAIENPADNLPLLVMFGLAMWQLLRLIVLFAMGFTKNLASERQGNQAIITQDNSLQEKLINEMAARRAADETFRNRLADLLDEKVTRIDGTTLRIDGTTLATQGQVATLQQEISDLKRALGIIYHRMKDKELVR